ncbi:MAG: aminotransferase class V-fold PLP-dependent enzyme [Pseudomonadota bacterium]
MADKTWHRLLAGHRPEREAFLVPEGLCYLNAAYLAPRLKAVQEAGLAGLARAGAPWAIKPAHFFDEVEAARTLFAALIGVSGENIALVPSASYGLETAARNLKIAAGEAILLLEAQFPSNVYPWRRLARKNKARIITVPRPTDGDWTAAVLAHMDDSVAIAALPHCHWTDGAMLDLAAISGACHAHGTALIIDATQSLGAVPLNVAAIKPAYLVAASYKWLLGPYSLGFLYVADAYLAGEPLEENWVSRQGAEDFTRLVHYRDAYQAGARRFDVGERNNPILVPMAIAALRQLLDWGVAEIAARLRTLGEAIAEAAAQKGYAPTPAPVRGPHMLGLRREQGLPHDLAARLAAANIHVSVRGASVRVAPHLHISAGDIERFIAALPE